MCSEDGKTSESHRRVIYSHKDGKEGAKEGRKGRNRKEVVKWLDLCVCLSITLPNSQHR